MPPLGLIHAPIARLVLIRHRKLRPVVRIAQRVLTRLKLGPRHVPTVRRENTNRMLPNRHAKTVQRVSTQTQKNCPRANRVQKDTNPRPHLLTVPSVTMVSMRLLARMTVKSATPGLSHRRIRPVVRIAQRVNIHLKLGLRNARIVRRENINRAMAKPHVKTVTRVSSRTRSNNPRAKRVPKALCRHKHLRIVQNAMWGRIRRMLLTRALSAKMANTRGKPAKTRVSFVRPGTSLPKPSETAQNVLLASSH